MWMAAIKKEFRLVFRDLHSVAVLFFMPAAFILIMSLALQNQFGDEKEFALTILYTDAAPDEYSAEFLANLKKHRYFQLQEVQGDHTQEEMLDLLGSASQVFIRIPPNLVDLFDPEAGKVEPVTIHLSPSIDPRTRLLVEAALQESLAKTKLHFLQAPMLASLQQSGEFISRETIVSQFLQGAAATETTRKPTAVQQNVPAWLIFSMFFVVIPISTTLITERQQGTLNRLRAMGVPMGPFLVAKSLPYLLINQVQLVIMLLLGIYLVPLLGGDRLDPGNQPFALMLLSLAVGIAAIGYALLVAVVARTTEQATVIGGVGNILLGAIGGIMVPRFVMPAYLQDVTLVSPMAWGLDGFLDVLLYGRGIAAIVPELLLLVGFGVIMLALALALFRNQR